MGNTWYPRVNLHYRNADLDRNSLRKFDMLQKSVLSKMYRLSWFHSFFIWPGLRTDHFSWMEIRDVHVEEEWRTFTIREWSSEGPHETLGEQAWPTSYWQVQPFWNRTKYCWSTVRACAIHHQLARVLWRAPVQSWCAQRVYLLLGEW